MQESKGSAKLNALIDLLMNTYPRERQALVFYKYTKSYQDLRRPTILELKGNFPEIVLDYIALDDLVLSIIIRDQRLGPRNEIIFDPRFKLIRGTSKITWYIYQTVYMERQGKGRQFRVDIDITSRELLRLIFDTNKLGQTLKALRDRFTIPFFDPDTTILPVRKPIRTYLASPFFSYSTTAQQPAAVYEPDIKDISQNTINKLIFLQRQWREFSGFIAPNGDLLEVRRGNPHSVSIDIVPDIPDNVTWEFHSHPYTSPPPILLGDDPTTSKDETDHEISKRESDCGKLAYYILSRVASPPDVFIALRWRKRLGIRNITVMQNLLIEYYLEDMKNWQFFLYWVKKTKGDKKDPDIRKAITGQFIRILNEHMNRVYDGDQNFSQCGNVDIFQGLKDEWYAFLTGEEKYNKAVSVRDPKHKPWPPIQASNFNKNDPNQYDPTVYPYRGIGLYINPMPIHFKRT
jgi:hypothetical protein